MITTQIEEKHCCSAHTMHEGYGHLVNWCQEDNAGHFWLTNENGRLNTMVQFCPFCGLAAPTPAIYPTPKAQAPKAVDRDETLLPPDRPLRVWVRFGHRVVMDHFLFGTVVVKAADGCHAKVRTVDDQEITVCVENLTELKSEPMLPKVGEKKVSKAKKDTTPDPELMKKYLAMALGANE